MKGLVIGLGEIGQPLFELLTKAYPDTVGFDLKNPSVEIPKFVDVLNICIPWSDKFVWNVRNYQTQAHPKVTVVHSTVPPGTTEQIPDAVNSPVLGRHSQMKQDMLLYKKWIGGAKAAEAAAYLEGAGFKCRVVPTARQTELMKLMCLAKYGVSLAFAMYQDNLCRKENILFEDVLEWDKDYNEHVGDKLKRPLIVPDGRIGGHCVLPGTKILNETYPSEFLTEVLNYGRMG